MPQNLPICCSFVPLIPYPRRAWGKRRVSRPRRIYADSKGGQHVEREGDDQAEGVAMIDRKANGRPERRRGRVKGARIGPQDRRAPRQEQVRLHRRGRGAHEEGQRLRQAPPRAGTKERCRGFEVAILLDELGPRPPEIAGAEPRSIVARLAKKPPAVQ